jgi:hypothetical protein
VTEAEEAQDRAKKDSKAPPSKAKKKKSQDEIKQELRSLTESKGPDKPPVDMKKMYARAAVVLVIAWVIAFIVPGPWGKVGAGVLTVAAVGLGFWLKRYLEKTQAIGALLKGADSDEGRKEALRRLESDFKKDDTTAVLARAQLEMQEDPRKALATLESVNLDKQLAPVAAQVRAMRTMIHLTLGELPEAKSLAEKLDLGKQQEAKTRAMFAAVASETWARTGQGQKAVDTLELFNPEDPDLEELRAQMWRARAFAYAATNDMKGAGRALRKLADMNPHLLGMFVGQKKIHPLLEREAKQIVMKLGVVPRKMVRQRM